MIWTPGDISGAQVLLDVDHLYASHINELRAAVQIANGKNALYYGVKGDGVTDDYAALQALLDLGGNIYLPPGTYLTSGHLDYHSNTFIHGAGRGVTIIKQKNGSNLGGARGLIEPEGYGTIGTTFPYVTNFLIEHLSIDGNKANNTGSLEGIVGQVSKNMLCYDLEVYNCGEVGINNGSWYAASPYTDYLSIQTINCIMHDNTGGGFQGIGGLIQGCVAYQNPGGFDSVITNPQADIERLTTLYIGCIADNNVSNGFTASWQAGTGRSIPVVWNGCSATNNGTGGFITSNKNTSLLNSVAAFNGINAYFGQCEHGAIQNNIFKNAQGALGYVAAGLTLDRVNKYLRIEGNRIFDDQDTPTQQYSIDYTNPDSNSVGNVIKNNTFFGNVISPIHAGFYENPYGGYANPFVLGFDIKDNKGYNPIGPSAITPGSSPYTYTAGPSPEEIYITGGTVSDIKRGSTTIATASPCRVHLEPHQTLVVTYSSAPTMVADKQ